MTKLRGGIAFLAVALLLASAAAVEARVCEEEQAELTAALEELEIEGPDFNRDRLERAWAALGECLVDNQKIEAGRRSYAGSWDERRYEHYRFLQEAWAEVIGPIKPLPDPGDPRTRELRTELSAKPELVMELSRAVAMALEKGGIQLAKDETFACVLFVIDKPGHASELIGEVALDSSGKPLPRVHVVVEPKLMQQVMAALEKDRLR